MVIDTVPFGAREMINGTPLRGVFFRDHAYGVTLKMGEGHRREGARDPTQLYFFGQVGRENLRVLGS